MATHSSTLAWKIPWTEEPGRLQFMGLQRVGHDWAPSSLTHSYEITKKLKQLEYLRTGNALYVLRLTHTEENYLAFRLSNLEISNLEIIDIKKCLKIYGKQQSIYTFLFFQRKKENKSLKNMD